jgi:hypothetical protein
MAQEGERLRSITDVVFQKVKEVEANRNAVLKSFIKDETANTLYLKSCIAEHHIVLPLMSKVREKTLCLQSYPIDKAHCKALADACRVLNNSINRVLIESCGLDDESFA